MIEKVDGRKYLYQMRVLSSNIFVQEKALNMGNMHHITPQRMKVSFIMLQQLGMVLMHFKSRITVMGLVMRKGTGMNIGQ